MCIHGLGKLLEKMTCNLLENSLKTPGILFSVCVRTLLYFIDENRILYDLNKRVYYSIGEYIINATRLQQHNL
jgi:hypothetical protein